MRALVSGMSGMLGVTMIVAMIAAVGVGVEGIACGLAGMPGEPARVRAVAGAGGGAAWHNEQGGLKSRDGSAAWCETSVYFPNMSSVPLAFGAFPHGYMIAGDVLVVRARAIGDDPAVFLNAVIKKNGVVIAQTELLGTYPALTGEWADYRLAVQSGVADLGAEGVEVWIGVAASGLGTSVNEVDGIWRE